MKSSLNYIGEVVQFQQRGSPHIHGLFYIKNALEFVDTYISCKSDPEDLPELVNLQQHKHSKTCKKEGQKIYRLNFSSPPVPKTIIL